MKNNKIPGEDGIPVDFYKVFWKELKEVFYDMVIESFESNQLHPSARKGILNLIPKSGKDTRYIKNLRPITLLNTDYKIIEKSIANKMTPALEQIIHTDQRGFMKNRRISVNIRKMLDIMSQAEKEDLETVVLSLDFVKCFDKCSFSILHSSLEFFGFGQKVKEWTKILYKDFTVKIQNNGNFSKPIDINKGVHQGGCCSALYFLVIAENNCIEGITLKEIRNLLNQFADDMDIFSKCTERSIKAIYKELEFFRQQSGFTVSYEKTTLYRIGSLRHSNAQLYDLDQFTWSNEDITVLGVTIAHENILEKNYTGIVEKAKKVLNSWCNRSLTLLGKVQVVNTLISSLFVYKMMVLPQLPSNIIKNMDNIVREFLWNGKKGKIAYNILQNPKREGGLGLVHLKNKDKSLKATWPQILDKEKEYAELVYSIMKVSKLKEHIWRCSLHPEDVKYLKIRNQFWEDVLKSWCKFNYYTDFRVKNQYIWYNSRIRVGGKPIFWRDIADNGLLYVEQLYSQGHMKSQDQVREEYGISTLRYNSLKSAIPQDWKEYFEVTSRSCYYPLPPHTYDMSMEKNYNLTQRIYTFLSEDVMVIHNKYIKWRVDLGMDLCNGLVEFGKMHMDIYSLTNNPKYRSFQYRLLQRGIVTNIQLCKWGIKDSENCYFCKQEPETIVHLLILCPVVQEIWLRFKQFVSEEFGNIIVELSPKNIMTNRVVKNKRDVINFMCLIVKQYIYSSRCLQKDLHFSAIKAKIKSVENVEKYIAIKNSKVRIHEKKWKKIDNIEGMEQLEREYIDNM